jgi:hypothetical protein
MAVERHRTAKSLRLLTLPVEVKNLPAKRKMFVRIQTRFSSLNAGGEKQPKKTSKYLLNGQKNN